MPKKKKNKPLILLVILYFMTLTKAAIVVRACKNCRQADRLPTNGVARTSALEADIFDELTKKVALLAINRRY
jgi:hypothetical protein